LRNRSDGTYDRSSSGFSGQGYRDRPQPLPGRSCEVAGGRRRVRWPGRVSLRGYARSRYSRWQIRCCGSPHARESRARGADGAQGSGQGVKPGGLIAVFDGDYASMTFALDDPLQSKRYDEVLINAIVTSPRVMRQMPRLTRQAGLETIRTFPYIMAEVGRGDVWLSAIDAYEKVAPKSGAMSEEEAASWANALHEVSDEGVFFGASN